MKRTIYLNMVSLDEAVDRVVKALDRDRLVAEETVMAEDAAGRVLSRGVQAVLSSPTFHSAAMDGVAVQAASTFQAREGAPVILREGEDFDWVNTGNPMPGDRDAVIMIEHVDDRKDGTIAVESPAFPWQHVRRIGEDIVATELLFPRNHRISPYDLGALLAAGVWEVPVWERIRLHIIPTGDEVLDYTLRPEPGRGQVVESNSVMLSAMARNLGCEASRVPPVADSMDAIGEAVRKGLESRAHVVVVCAGSSAGSKDFTRRIIEQEGEVLVHGVTAMPGKPSLLGKARGKLMVGAPGYPVSSVVCFEEMVARILAWLGRFEAPVRDSVEVQLNRRCPSKLGMEEFLRMSVGKVGEEYVATPLGRGAGNITTMCRAQGVARIPVNSEGIEQGSRIRAELLRPLRELDATLVVVGSHDNTLDVLADELMGLDPSISMSSSHVGSLGGLMALKNGAAHMAGAHLFDPAGNGGNGSPEFNFPFIAKYLGDRDVTVVNMAIRHQGLMVAPGNPKNIRGIRDLARDDIRFVNRQRGAGTRILFDYHLACEKVDHDRVEGYGKEEFTHMAVAVNVLTGTADCGMGIHAAAKALGLDFLPLARERYDLVIPTAFLEEPVVRAVLALLGQERIAKKIQAMGGYETTLTGRVMSPGMGLGD